MDVPEKSQGPDSLPPNFPYPWCSDYGEDKYGVFMAFTYEGVRQGFRWIPPGTFWMGSPHNEVGRYDGTIPEWQETQHEVTLTKGFWLAETTCEQALWQAVMHENPSEFKGERNPVDNVSWVNSQEFIKALNALHPEFGLRLPTEAEWERACRAGTQTAYWFGDRIDKVRVHFGNSVGMGALPAKALEPNPWGLYQMHGNVNEWCGDWLSTYPSHSVSNPQGPGSGQSRVLRGGSWLNLGRFCRSADRGGSKPGNANHRISFRLARDP